MEVTQMSTDRIMDKEDVVHLYKGIILCQKKKKKKENQNENKENVKI